MAARLARRGYAPTLLVGVASAGVATIGASKPWVSATAVLAGLPTIHARVDGADIAPQAGALGFVLLAAFGAVIATRGWVRRCIGGLVVVSAVVVLVAVVHPGDTTAAVEHGLSAKGWAGGGYDAGATAWRWVAGVGALGCLLAGTLVGRFGGSWTTMNARYDAPGAAEDPARSTSLTDPTEADLWRSIDRGHDPTQSP